MGGGQPSKIASSGSPREGGTPPPTPTQTQTQTFSSNSFSSCSSYSSSSSSSDALDSDSPRISHLRELELEATSLNGSPAKSPRSMMKKGSIPPSLVSQRIVALPVAELTIKRGAEDQTNWEARIKTSPRGSVMRKFSTEGGGIGAPRQNKIQEDEGGWNAPVLYSRTMQKVTIEDYELLNVIGKGSFGKVMQVKKKNDGKIYAMKVLRKEFVVKTRQVEHTRAERSILEKVEHPFIVRLHAAFQNEGKLYMVMDFINGGELFFHLKKEGRFDEKRAMFYAAELVEALAHLHSLNIVYRDLKPENILLDSEGHITLTDFGLSKEVRIATNTFCGTPEYLAPEVLKGLAYGAPVDWWTLGALLYEMMVGIPPFYCSNQNIMYQKILKGQVRFPSTVSSVASSLISALLMKEAEQRLGSSADASEIRAHPFFSNIEWAKLLKKEIQPPFKPGVTSSSDVSQVDPEFIKLVAEDSVVDHLNLIPLDANFTDFTFVKGGLAHHT